MNGHWETEWLNSIEVDHLDEWMRAGYFFGARGVFTKMSAYLPYSPHVLNWMKTIIICHFGWSFRNEKNVFHSVYCVFAFEANRSTLFCPHFYLEIRIRNENEYKRAKYFDDMRLAWTKGNISRKWCESWNVVCAYTPLKRPYSNKFYAFEIPLNIKSHTINGRSTHHGIEVRHQQRGTRNKI